ncbi:putative metal-binding motif-containing protein [Candidatus Woesearchaeota archaeon]|nr:putative metal-binding motif-containing protein [Candidatus Woesearchaeota archaeon]
MRKSLQQTKFFNNKKNIIVLLSFILLFLLVKPYNAEAELLRIVCWATPPQVIGYSDPRYFWTPDRDGNFECVQAFGDIPADDGGKFTEVPDNQPVTLTYDCPDSVICCSTRINQDITVFVKTIPWITGIPDVQSQVFPKFSSCGGGSCGYLNDCTGQCVLRSGNSCFDGQNSCSGNNYLTCNGCSWRDNGLISGQCGVSPNYGQNCNQNACGQFGGTIQINGQCSGPTPALPSNYGQNCNQNACGQFGGTIQCNGQCSGPTPPNPVGYGTSCTVGTGTCQKTGTVTCSGSCSATQGTPTAEICDNLDNNCNNQVDEGCDDDKDNYCDSNIQRVGTPSICTSGGNDCNDNSASVNPGVNEVCRNNYLDDNCNGETDYDSIDGKHGDSQCPVAVNSIQVSISNPVENTNIQVTCASSIDNINSISAFIENNLCGFSSWQGSNAIFNCNAGAYTGNPKTIKCSVDTAKSYKSGTDKTTTVNVIPSLCSSYSSSSVCSNDNRCEWRNECSGTKYSGSAGCVNKGSFSYACTKDKCGATCDPTRGGCPQLNCNNLDGCYSGTYRDYQNADTFCQDSCSCSSASCNQFNSLVTDNDNDGYDTQCDNDCNDNNANVNPGKSECCDLGNLVDENCNNQVNEICDRDRDGVIDANAQLCQPKTITNYVDIFNQIRNILGIK